MRLSNTVLLSILFGTLASPVFAQSGAVDDILKDLETQQQNEANQMTPRSGPEVVPDEPPDAPDIAPLIDPPDDTDALVIEPIQPQISPAPEVERPEEPDYSQLTEAQEREARLERLFERLAKEENAETANLIAESIWAIWLDSDSDTVNLLLRRGTAAEKQGNRDLARRLYDSVTTLSPDYAEGWSRSARLAITEEDLSRALSEVTRALILEPRHFYGYWTLGNIFERIGKNDAALEAYAQANALYPELKAVTDRLDLLRQSSEGDLL